MVDDRKPSFEITSHLIKLGHEKIAIIAGEKNALPSQYRLQGFMEAIEAHNLTISKDLICFGDFKEEGGREEMKKLLALATRGRQFLL